MGHEEQGGCRRGVKVCREAQMGLTGCGETFLRRGL